MIQKIYDSTASKRRPRPYNVQIVQKHTKNTPSIYPAFWHNCGIILNGVYFHFFKHPRSKRAGEYLYLTLNQCYRTHIPHTHTHLSHLINLISKPSLLIFTTETISTNSTRITFISFMFDGDSFYFCPLFHRIQPYLYPFIQTK